VTPSYINDFERCKLLCESKAKFSPYPIKHYIIVDTQDLELFKSLENDCTVILPKEKLLPWWIKKLPLTKKNIWVSLKTPPVRGWLIQQIIKIAVAHHVEEDVLIFADSDVFFVRNFVRENFVRADKVRFYRKLECVPADMKEGHFLWYKTASRLLESPDIDFPANDYINQLVTWRRENVLQLCKRLEEVSGKNWIQTLCGCWNLSEYILYGVFIDHFLKENSGHYFEATDISFNHFSEESLSKEEIKIITESVPQDKIAIMFSAKADIPIDYYKNVVFQ
jgi:hypothetical protein